MLYVTLYPIYIYDLLLHGLFLHQLFIPLWELGGGEPLLKSYYRKTSTFSSFYTTFYMNL